MRPVARPRHFVAPVLAATVLLVLAACGSNDTPTVTPSLPSTVALSGSITVLAASSLTESFNEIGRRFQDSHPGVHVTFSFDASSTLVQQAVAGAPADVLVTADTDTMQKAVDAGAVSAPTVFAHNRLSIIVAKGNPKGIHGLADLSRPGLVVVLCAVEVPCGKFAAQSLAKAGATVTPKSLEPNVKGVVSKVTLGEADAGIVYSTDVKAAGAQAEGVTIPPQQNVVADYPIATLKSTKNAALAAAFVAFVRSGEGTAVLTGAGFDV
jgi:molybdate transport system substrate-binding protein